MQVFNTFTQQLEDAAWDVGNNGEIVATFNDGHFLKFPAGLTQDELQQSVDEQAAANRGMEIITPEQERATAAAQQASTDLVDQLNQEGVKTNASATTSQSAA